MLGHPAILGSPLLSRAGCSCFPPSRANVPCWGLISPGEGGPGGMYVAGRLKEAIFLHAHTYGILVQADRGK